MLYLCLRTTLSTKRETRKSLFARVDLDESPQHNLGRHTAVK